MSIKHGLLKAYLDQPSIEELEEELEPHLSQLLTRENYENQPDRLGVTLKYGDVSQANLELLQGKFACIETKRLYVGVETIFIECEVFCDDREVLRADHITIAWVEGSAPVVAGRELRESREKILPSVPFEMILGGFVEFLELAGPKTLEEAIDV